MVSLKTVQASNARIAKELPEGLVAVFVGSTSGIGEYSMVQFAKHAVRPRIHFVGRSQEAADRLHKQMTALNPEGTYTFHKADTSLLRNVDDVCRAIKEKEKAINLLLLSTGSLLFGTKTAEDLHFSASLVTYSRNRFIVNLLPLLEQAPSLRRVVSVFAGGKEGAVFVNDLQGLKVNPLKARGHISSIVTLSMGALAAKAPSVTFVHSFPGFVRSNLVRGGEGMIIGALKHVSKLGELVGLYIPNEDSGDRHVFLATSAMFPPGAESDSHRGVSLEAGEAVAGGSDGKPASGVYAVNENSVVAGPKVVALLAGLRKDGTAEMVWADQEAQFMRITGSAKI